MKKLFRYRATYGFVEAAKGLIDQQESLKRRTRQIKHQKNSTPSVQSIAASECVYPVESINICSQARSRAFLPFKSPARSRLRV